MRRLIVDPLTRIEGHGRVELLLKDGHLHNVRVRLIESPRLFEAMVIGRQFNEIPDLVCRICAICSAVHKLTALEALEKALALEIPPLANKIRELLLLGGHIQSHALHLFCLVLPDFSSDQSVLDLLKRGDRLAQSGLALKALGNQIQEVAGGRVIHPINPVVGGVVFRPTRQDLEAIREAIQTRLKTWVDLASEYCSRAHFPSAQPLSGRLLATGRPDVFALQGDSLWYSPGQSVPVEDYRQILQEETVDHSFAKQTKCDSEPHVTGALARVKLAATRGCLDGFSTEFEGIHANNAAQLQEVGWALERSLDLVERILEEPPSAGLISTARSSGAGMGTAAKEAPRGLLVHHYVLDEWGQVMAADVITPTAVNQLAMAAQITADLADEKSEEQLKLAAERIIRSFDPCISCAVHLCQI